jgi:hypothetical protein
VTPIEQEAYEALAKAVEQQEVLVKGLRAASVSGPRLYAHLATRRYEEALDVLRTLQLAKHELEERDKPLPLETLPGPPLWRRMQAEKAPDQLEHALLAKQGERDADLENKREALAPEPEPEPEPVCRQCGAPVGSAHGGKCGQPCL